MEIMALQCLNSRVLAMGVKVGRELEGGGGGRPVVKVQKRWPSVVAVRVPLRYSATCRRGDHAGPLAEDYEYNESALSGNSVHRSVKSGDRDWRVYSSGNGNGLRGDDGGRPATGLNATVENASDIGTQESNQMFGSSEASRDEGSSFLAVESILENEGGKSVKDYKLRADIFSESAIFFTALKDRNRHSLVQ